MEEVLDNRLMVKSENNPNTHKYSLHLNYDILNFSNILLLIFLPINIAITYIVNVSTAIT